MMLKIKWVKGYILLGNYFEHFIKAEGAKIVGLCNVGAFIGCSLEGSVVTTRARENSRFYGSQSLSASKILLGSLPQPPAAATLYRALEDLCRQMQR